MSSQTATAQVSSNLSSQTATAPVAAQKRPGVYWTISDGLAMAGRQLRQIPRVPEELITATLQPAALLLIFRYLLGGAVIIPGTSYVNYLVAGMFVQSVLFGSTSTGVGVANDLQRGLIDRFRSLPMAQSAVLTGRIFADLPRYAVIILVTAGVGLLVGFQPDGSVLSWAAAIGLLLLIGFAFSWISALVGLAIRSVEAAQQATLIWLLPFAFFSSALVPVDTLPGWLSAFANHQPASLTIDAVRGLLLGHPSVSTTLQAVIWCVALLVVFIPLTVWAYGRRTAL